MPKWSKHKNYNLVSLIITYRNRDCRIVKRCLDALANQTEKAFVLYLVDYGSQEQYAKALRELVAGYSFVELLSFPVQKQLWNKSRAINIALQKISTPYTFIGDIDMIFRHDFMSRLIHEASAKASVYFKVGYLSEQESKTDKNFEAYAIHHFSTDEATGMTLYPTALLREINGYDEFYHGWGSEDTDVHYRLRNAGYTVRFYDSEILMLHQWHPKSYRTLDSKEPFHTELEKINSYYLSANQKNGIIKANTNFQPGQEPSATVYENLASPSVQLCISNEQNEVCAFLYGNLTAFEGKCIEVCFVSHPQYKSAKNRLKKILKKKHFQFFSMQELNNKILECIVTNFRNAPYQYEYLAKESTIILRIKI